LRIRASRADLAARVDATARRDRTTRANERPRDRANERTTRANDASERRDETTRRNDAAMSKKNNRTTAANRVEHAKRVEREALVKKEARRVRKMAAMALASDAMAVDGAGGKGGTAGRARLEAKNVRKAQSLRLAGGVRKVRAGKNTHKVVRGVPVGKAKLRKNAVVMGIKIVDAATKQAALDAIAEARGDGGATAMRR
tara:strand:- start:4175 stop:4774 length:600 start_codon:yes stop_codon:yes gene_type:complete